MKEKKIVYKESVGKGMIVNNGDFVFLYVDNEYEGFSIGIIVDENNYGLWNYDNVELWCDEKKGLKNVKICGRDYWWKIYVMIGDKYYEFDLGKELSKENSNISIDEWNEIMNNLVFKNKEVLVIEDF